MLTYLHKLRFSNGTRLASAYARSFFRRFYGDA